MITEFINAAETEVKNHSIYVWGGSGQLCKNVTESWIRTQEAKNEKGKHADDAVKAWKEVMASPYKDVARLFDCSGYVSWCLTKCGAFNGRTNCDGLFARSTEIYTPEDGCLLFRVNPSKPSDETHVGIYYQGKQYHAKGRAYGVVCESYKSSYWQKLAWFKKMEHDEPEPKPQPTEKKVVVIAKSVNVRNKGNTGGKVLFTAHNKAWYKAHGQTRDSDTFPLFGFAESGWYQIGEKEYITNKARYTSLE